MTQTINRVNLELAEDLSYSPQPGVLDEVVDAEGNIKQHWKYVLDGFKGLGPEAVAGRQAKAQRILRDDGASYNINSDYSSQSAPRTWGLDLVPSLISSEDWAVIEAGLLERAELFNLLLKDIYGPRHLIRQGVIPPEALFSHKGFLRACQGTYVPGDHQLILHAADLMRGSDGDMWVLTDRTQSPNGAGYALENRTVMSRVLPSLFRDSHVHRLSGFFQGLRNKLTSLSPNQDQPQVVVLSPGADNESYFEHAYFANYLGFYLVQSGDLVVRNGHVWMKSLDGLSRVDVILRRVDDSFCDPVELRSDSQLGVANLLEVVRAGRVVIANPLGSGVLESPVFIKYLPEIAKALLGRELRLKSVPTYWCGDAKDMAFIQANLASLVIKPAFRSGNEHSVVAASLSHEQQQTLIAKLHQNPLNFVAQPIMAAGQLPTFIENRLESRPSLLRSFTVAGHNSYTVMPGGLTRVGVEQSSFIISSLVGSQSKDTWVIASEPERNSISEDDADKAPFKEADLISLPSRVVENLFWMGRYAERAEASLRILRTVFMLLNGEEPVSDVCRRIMLQAVTDITSTQPGFIGCSDTLIAAPEKELLLVITDGSRVGSVKSTLNAMLKCADKSKELLSSDTLRVINDIRDALTDLDGELSGGLASAPEEALNPLVTALMALSGLARESMVRDFGWRFMDIGRRLERGVQTAKTIKNLLVPEVLEADQNVLIDSLLTSLEALISYRRRYRARMGVQSSLDLVMMDTSNPRSLLYQLAQLSKHIRNLPSTQDNRHELPPEERAALEGETIIKLSRLTEMSAREDGQRKLLASNLERIISLFGSINNFISDKYFDHRESSQQLVRTNWDNS
ncbi:MAG: circularly permuted type 2 ATP-grasp protein [Spongiibacteraceae bacterium]